MFDISWSEFLLIIIVAVVAIGPKQLPGVLYGLGRIVRRMQYMRFALSKQFDDFMEQNDLKGIKTLNPSLSDMALRGGSPLVEEDEIAREDTLKDRDNEPAGK